jgi:O-acetyl-ADP-ribose deacetylase (regulator of RNase III)
MITYHLGDATEPELDGTVVLAHVLSDTGAYGAGFAAAVARRYPRARAQFAAWHQGDTEAFRRPLRLGAIQWVGVGHDLGRRHGWSDRWVVHMVAQRGLRSATNPHPLDLDALHSCLSHLAYDLAGEPVVMPRIGCGLAGGTWAEVEPVVNDVLVGVAVHVYDLGSQS